MNIFYLDSDQRRCARQHVDKHCVKMILEYAQLLSTAHRVIDGRETTAAGTSGRRVKRWVLDDFRDDVLYQATHANHPSAVWARSSLENYLWLHGLFEALLEEYTHRYGRSHSCARLAGVLSVPPNGIKEGGFTEPTPAMPDEYKVPGDSVSSYRNYYMGAKRALFSWKGREVPEFITLP